MTAKANPSTLRFSGGVFTLSLLHLPDQEMGSPRQALAAQGTALQLLRGAAVVLDLAGTDPARVPAYAEWRQSLREFDCFLVGIRNASDTQAAAAAAQGLPHLRGNETKEAPPPKTPQPAGASSGTVLTQPLRSGQRHYGRGGDLVCVGAVNAGAEVLADGHIHIYGPLRGRALAGVQGDETARIFCQRLEAELIAIAGVYMTLDDTQPLWGQAAQVSLAGEHLHIIPLDK